MSASRQTVTHAEQVTAAAFVRASLRFEYEPKEFRIHHPNGNLNGFNPDFFLPTHRLYIEVGNPNHKKTKLRWMRAAYPNVRVLVIDNLWADEIDKLNRFENEQDEEIFGDQVMPYIWEKWVEQEYYDAHFFNRRQQAREESREARHEGVIGPSMRVC